MQSDEMKTAIRAVITVLTGVGTASVLSNILGINVVVSAVLAIAVGFLCHWALSTVCGKDAATPQSAPDLGLVNVDTRATDRPRRRRAERRRREDFSDL